MISRGRFVAGLAAGAPLAFLGASPSPGPTGTPAPDAEAQRIFARARDVWRKRTEPPYVSCGALVRYTHGSKTFDNWWQAYYRDSDKAFTLRRIVIPEDDRQRLKGIPFTLFGIKVFDTNPDAEPIRVDEPDVLPNESFGVATRGDDLPPLTVGTPPASTPDATGTPLREIGSVAAVVRDYDIRLVGTEQVSGGPAYHLTLTPLRDPRALRLRDVWVTTDSYRTVQLATQGIFEGKPYDGVRWLVTYVTLNDRQFVQQIKSQEPMRFGLDTIIPEMELDFVDYHFEDLPKYFFDKLRF